MIPIYEPYLNQEILSYAHDALDSGWISSTGKYVESVESQLAELLGVKHVLLTSSGTAAMHLVMRAVAFRLGIEGVQRVIVPDNVYVAAWNAVLMTNDQWPMEAVDADIETWNMDLSRMGIGEGSVVLVVHNLGNIINVPELKRRYPKATFVEDNCEGFLGKYEGAYSGTASLCSALSFFANKTITSGEGGAFVTDDDDVYEHIKSLRNQGQTKHRYIHSDLGYNYRMTNVQAAILQGQLLVLDEIIGKKWDLFHRYRMAFSKLDRVYCQRMVDGTVHSNWMMGIGVVNNPGFAETERFFEARGVSIRPMFYPIQFHPHLSSVFYDDTTVAELLSKECFMIPSYPGLEFNEVSRVIDVVGEYVKDTE